MEKKQTITEGTNNSNANGTQAERNTVEPFLSQEAIDVIEDWVTSDLPMDAPVIKQQIDTLMAAQSLIIWSWGYINDNDDGCKDILIRINYVIDVLTEIFKKTNS